MTRPPLAPPNHDSPGSDDHRSVGGALPAGALAPLERPILVAGARVEAPSSAAMIRGVSGRSPPQRRATGTSFSRIGSRETAAAASTAAYAFISRSSSSVP